MRATAKVLVSKMRWKSYSMKWAWFIKCMKKILYNLRHVFIAMGLQHSHYIISSCIEILLYKESSNSILAWIGNLVIFLLTDFLGNLVIFLLTDSSSLWQYFIQFKSLKVTCLYV
uniref:Uncharacterized protein n=1 Tax=Cacopsylla melanoneura TaxID=428564 RepID=A0A8D8S848_9HEMI